MEESSRPAGAVKAALFVDFDNIYTGLRKVHPAAADEFAYNPARWLAWFEQGMPSRDAEGAAGDRRALLLRLCYLNPVMFGKFRAYFTRSAFRVVDCPPLTQQNKNSTDIHMVMDILDAQIKHEHVKEFIILSGDSDFTPVLLRLRLFDRRTVILTPGPVAQSYKAASDLVISEDVFIEDGLGLRPERVRRPPAAAEPPPRLEPQPPPRAEGGEEQVLDAMARKLHERAAAQGPIPAAGLAGLYRQFPSFAASNNWLGFNTLIDLTRELARRRAGMHVAECLVDGKKSWEVRAGLSSAQQDCAPGAQDGAAGLDEKILARVGEMVAASPSPVSMAAAAADVIKHVGQEVLTTQWAGAGSFKELLRSAPAKSFRVATSPDGPGYLYDPARHAAPAAAAPLPDASERWEGHPEGLSAFARRVSRVTGAPPLRPEEYAVVFKALEDELRDEDYFLASTSRAVRDRCTLRGHPASRNYISFILKGITYGGHDFAENPLANTAEVFAQVFREQVLRLCKGAQLDLSGEEQRLLEQWIKT